MRHFIFVAFCIFNSLIVFGQTDQNTFLWEISKRGIKHKSYLFGTFHEAGNSAFDSLFAVNFLLGQSKELLIESNDSTYNVGITQDDVDKGYEIWKSILSREQQRIFYQFADKNKLAAFYAMPGYIIVNDLHHEYISRFCPKSIKDTIFVMDIQIKLIAEKNKIRVLALDEMIGYSDTLNLKDKIIKTDTSTITEMINLMTWILNEKYNQEPCVVQKQYFDTKYSYDFETKIDSLPFAANYRNKKWLDIIIKEINKTSCFIAVGFNHLRFQNGLIARLRKKRYRVVPIPMK